MIKSQIVDGLGRGFKAEVTENNELRVILSTTSPDLKDIAIGKVLTGGSAANTSVPVRRTTYTEQTTNGQRSVKSDSANDTAAGTGARTIILTYYPSDLSARKTETMVLNGTTAVTTMNSDICFIESIKVVTVGSGGTNAGNISLYVNTLGTGTVIGSIAVDTSGSANQEGIDGRTFWAQHYVVSGETCSIIAFNAGTNGNQVAEAFLAAKDPTNANAAELQISDSIAVNTSAGAPLRTILNSISIIGPARVLMYVVPAGNNTAFFGSFDFSES